MTTLVFDIGGTNIRLGVTQGKKLTAIVHQPVPKRYDRAVALIAQMAKSLRATKIIGGLPGPMDPAHTKLIQSTNLPGWVGQPFARDLQRSSRTKVRLENDAALGALGEAVYGAGRPAKIVAYIGFGTGIGGARIVDRQIDANAKGFEPGHHIVDWHTTHHRHRSPHPGDWESFVSGTGIFVATGKKSEFVTSKKVWRQAEQQAATGLVNVAVFWSPDVIVLGGSLMKKMSMTNIEREYRKKMRIFPNPPKLKKAQLGDFSGLYGALALSR